MGVRAMRTQFRDHSIPTGQSWWGKLDKVNLFMGIAIIGILVVFFLAWAAYAQAQDFGGAGAGGVYEVDDVPESIDLGSGGGGEINTFTNKTITGHNTGSDTY